MSPEMWRIISIVCLVIGIIFLIITIVLALNFRLLGIITSGIAGRKNAKNSNDDDYFKKTDKIDSEPFVTENQFGDSEPVYQYQQIPEPDTATVVNTSGSAANPTVITSVNQVPEASSETVMISSKDSKPAADISPVISTEETRAIPDRAEREAAEGFIILETILEIHGNPDNIRKIEA